MRKGLKNAWKKSDDVLLILIDWKIVSILDVLFLSNVRKAPNFVGGFFYSFTGSPKITGGVHLTGAFFIVP